MGRRRRTTAVAVKMLFDSSGCCGSRQDGANRARLGVERNCTITLLKWPTLHDAGYYRAKSIVHMSMRRCQEEIIAAAARDDQIEYELQ